MPRQHPALLRSVVIYCDHRLDILTFGPDDLLCTVFYLLGLLSFGVEQSSRITEATFVIL